MTNFSNKLNNFNRLVLLFTVISASAFAQVLTMESVETMGSKEEFLKSFDLTQPGLTFKRLGGGTTSTNWGVKKDGKYVANLKCTAGNTYAPAAIAVYRLGQALSFNIYPVAINKPNKMTIDGISLDGKSCALKEWSSGFSQLNWNREHLTSGSAANEHNTKMLRVIKRCDVDYNPNEEFYYYANSSYGDPKINDSQTKYYGKTTLEQAARDFSNMLVMDVLIGNDDRLPGGNVHFRSVAVENRYQIKDDSVIYSMARLFSLDNEASFKGYADSNSHKDILLIRRFDRAMMNRLKVLRQKLLEQDPVYTDSLKFRLLRSGKRYAYESVIKNIEFILERAESSKSCYFN